MFGRLTLSGVAPRVRGMGTWRDRAGPRAARPWAYGTLGVARAPAHPARLASMRLPRPGSRRTAELEQRVADLTEQRDRLRGRIDEFERDRRLSYVFVVTYGRSGSTLVQGLLNSIPGYLVRGENRQIMRHLWAFDKEGLTERQTQRRKQRKRGAEVGASDATSPLFGMDNFAHRAALNYARKIAVRTLFRPEEDTRVTGFKEILWGEEDTPEFVEWLREVFPEAKFVINTRDLSAVAQSAWWAEDPDAVADLQRREDLLLALRDQLGDAAYHIRYDEFTEDPTVLRGLFEWLGEPWDEESVRDVLGTRHSFRPRSSSTSDEAEGDDEQDGNDQDGDD
jgi:hypothetical protein